MKRVTYATLVTAIVLGCNSHPVEEPICGSDGDNVRLPTERELCVYRQPIVIETGFMCPAERADRTDFPPHFSTCSNFGPPIGIERDFLIDRFGVPGRPWPVYATNNTPAPDTDALDLLWVIDNSGSMCQEQAALRQNATTFLAGLAAQNVDFQVAVTTTDMSPDYVLEPVARPGAVQSVPQPVPGFDRSCHTAVDEMGQQVDGDYSPIRDSLAVAVGCMATPDETFLELSNADIECALYATPQGCVIARAGCGGAGTPCVPEDIFPSPDSYRSIPSILRAGDYRVDGEVDTEAIAADFVCASLVGTRGYGIEKGLSAAVAAVAPENVKSVNEGLLRDGARFAVMFISDENDCSHDGTLAEDTACGGDVCEFWNREDLIGGPLLPVSDLKAQLLGNLSIAKGRVVSESEVFVGSISGQSGRFEGEFPADDQCAAATYEGIRPTCATNLGVAYSGDRYIRFTSQFVNAFPRPDAEGNAVGWICTGDISPALSAIGDWLGSAVE